MNASVILIRCPKSKRVFGARTRQMRMVTGGELGPLLLMKIEQKEKDMIWKL